MFRCFIPGARKSLGTDRVQGHTGGETMCLVEPFMPVSFMILNEKTEKNECRK